MVVVFVIIGVASILLLSYSLFDSIPDSSKVRHRYPY